MRQETELQFKGMLSQQAKLNNTQYVEGSDSVTFSVDPSVEQRFEEKIVLQSDLLQKVNVEPVRDLVGDTMMIDSVSSIAGRTDTTVESRETADPTGEEAYRYECKKTDYDTHIRYQKLDQWRKFPNFQERWTNVVLKQIAKDRLTIAFNGTHAAAKTNRETNPLLQDVNIGWLEKIRQHNAGSQHETGIAVGGANDYKNIDALVQGMINEMIDEVYSEDTGLVVLTGRNVVHDKYLALVNQTDAATERAALSTQLLNKQLGNTPTVRVPFFPANSILVTRLDMLSIYWQEESRRRKIKDQAERDRIQDFQSVNEAYVVEDYRACAFIENISYV
jgi:P2 family phage major capsid protein